MNPTQTFRPTMSKHLIGPHPKQQRRVLVRILTDAQTPASKPAPKIDPVCFITWSIILLASAVGWSVVLYTLLHP